MPLHIVGQRVLVRPEPLEEKRGDIIIARPQELERAERAATQKGTVLQLGDLAFKDIGDGLPWCAAGDVIIYARHSGKFLIDPDTAEELFLIRDEDVQAVVTKKKGKK